MTRWYCPEHQDAQYRNDSPETFPERWKLAQQTGAHIGCADPRTCPKCIGWAVEMRKGERCWWCGLGRPDTRPVCQRCLTPSDKLERIPVVVSAPQSWVARDFDLSTPGPSYRDCYLCHDCSQDYNNERYWFARLMTFDEPPTPDSIVLIDVLDAEFIG